MNRFLYNVVLRLARPFVLGWLEKRAKRAGGEWQVRSPERFGRYDSPEQNFDRPVWVHAVSLGEVRAAQPLIQCLLDKKYPVLLTHMTATGKEQGKRFFEEAIRSGQLRQAWIPFDFEKSVNGFLNHFKPRCGLLIEREIWPNMVLCANAQNIPMIVVSARFSESSLNQSRWLGSVMRQAMLSITLYLAQTRTDALRLKEFGIERVKISGNLKFDVKTVKKLQHIGHVIHTHIGRPTIVLASTRSGEEDMFLHAMKNPSVYSQTKKNKTLYIIVPRHPQRFAQVQELLETSGLSFELRSKMPTDQSLRECDVLLGDTVGEMAMYYAMSDLAIVCGSFVNLGGQNHIEASALGLPVIVGPYTQNFEQAVEDAIVEGAARRTEDPLSALLLAHDLLQDRQKCEAMSEAALRWLSLHEGATQRVMEAIEPYLV